MIEDLNQMMMGVERPIASDIFVTGFASDVTEEFLKEIFSQYGLVRCLDLVWDHRSSTWASHMRMGSAEEAQRLVDNLNQNWYDYRKRLVGSMARPNGVTTPVTVQFAEASAKGSKGPAPGGGALGKGGPPGRMGIYCTSRADVLEVTDYLTADTECIYHPSYGQVDCVGTYKANLKDPDADPVLPGFAKEAIQNNPAQALKRFVNFCRCQQGQRGLFRFCFWQWPRTQDSSDPAVTRTRTPAWLNKQDQRGADSTHTSRYGHAASNTPPVPLSPPSQTQRVCPYHFPPPALAPLRLHPVKDDEIMESGEWTSVPLSQYTKWRWNLSWIGSQWYPVWSEQHRRYYYWNKSTDETAWQMPGSVSDGVAPPVPSSAPRTSWKGA